MQTLATRKPSRTQGLATTKARKLRTFLLEMQFNPLEIGARIKQARLEAGLTQNDLAGMGSFSYRSVQGWETGERIPFKHFAELSQLLRKSSEWFLYGEEADSTAEDRYEMLLERLGQVEAQQQELLEALRARLPEAPEDAGQ
jgi:transcriptional regulator with XRE-family HTH domain